MTKTYHKRRDTMRCEVLSKFIQCLFKQKVMPSTIKELKKAEIIIGQSFGVRNQDDPGKSNEILADYARVHKNYYNLPMILQWEIAHFFPNQIDSDCIIREHRVAGKYLDTHEVLCQSRNICDQKFSGARKAIIIAHPDHMWRVLMTAQKLGFKPAIPLMGHVPYAVWSRQIWTKSKFIFIPCDRLVRIKCLIEGKI
jgi:hypothetical protein